MACQAASNTRHCRPKRQRPMEQFHDGHHVRLRSYVLGTYLHADHDGEGVSLRRRRASLKQAWAVHLHLGEDGVQYVLLHSAAYGRYLAATGDPAPRGLRVTQRDHDQPQANAIRWHALRAGIEDDYDIVLRHGALYSYRYLRANRRHLHRYNSVSAAIFNFSNMMRWIVEPIPARQGVPRLPGSIRARLLIEEGMRQIRFVPVQANDHDELFAEEDWATFQFRGRSVYRLRNELATRIGVSDLIMCVRAGRHGRLTPLVRNLPRDGQTIEIVVIIGGTPANAQLRHPDVTRSRGR
ncbi:unnamed protein product [Alopecurus aequalis]